MFASVSFENPPCYPSSARGSLESLPFVHQACHEDGEDYGQHIIHQSNESIQTLTKNKESD